MGLHDLNNHRENKNNIKSIRKFKFDKDISIAIPIEYWFEPRTYEEVKKYRDKYITKKIRDQHNYKIIQKLLYKQGR